MAETNKARDKPEEVQHISLSKIHPFPEHPFQVRDDELMQQTIDSIQQVGILTPVILRPDDAGGFEMISGHRRLYAAGLAGLETIYSLYSEEDTLFAKKMCVKYQLLESGGSDFHGANKPNIELGTGIGGSLVKLREQFKVDEKRLVINALA